MSHAPYIDEETANRERLKNEKRLSKRKDKEIAKLKDDKVALESEISVLKGELANVKTVSAIKQEKPTKSANKATNSEQVAAGQTFNVSYYGMDCVGCTGITASGLNVKGGQTHYKGMRILAADTSILPLHTVVKVTNPDGSSYTGTVKDRGGAIKGHKLDVLVGSEAESTSHGRHDAKVEIIERGDNSYRRE